MAKLVKKAAKKDKLDTDLLKFSVGITVIMLTPTLTLTLTLTLVTLELQISSSTKHHSQP